MGRGRFSVGRGAFFPKIQNVVLFKKNVGKN